MREGTDVRSQSRLKVASVLLLSAGILLAVPSAAHAVTTIDIDFLSPGYTIAPGSPAGQNGWIASGVQFDYGLVDNSDFPDSGLGAGRSLRLSNGASVSGNPFLRSPQIEQAGEPGEAGAVGNTFTGTYTITSATGALQEGLLLEVPIDASTRYGGIIDFRHTASGLEVGSYWIPPEATNTANSSWRSEIFATVDPSVSHTVTVEAHFLRDMSDVVRVRIDGELVSGCTGLTTWEHYWNLTGGVTDRTVNELTFRRTSSAPTGTGNGFIGGLPPAPATQGLGALFSDISYAITTTSLPSPENPPVPESVPASDPQLELSVQPTTTDAGGAVLLNAAGFEPGEDVAVVQYPEGEIVGWLTADGAGFVEGSIDVPTTTPIGSHQLQLNGSRSSCTAVASVQVTPSALPPSPPAPPTGLAEGGYDASTAITLAVVLLFIGTTLLVVSHHRSQQGSDH